MKFFVPGGKQLPISVRADVTGDAYTSVSDVGRAGTRTDSATDTFWHNDPVADTGGTHDYTGRSGSGDTANDGFPPRPSSDRSTGIDRGSGTGYD